MSSLLSNMVYSYFNLNKWKKNILKNIEFLKDNKPNRLALEP